MKVALSGATGFVGKHVLAELEKRQFTPTLLIRPTPIHTIPKLQHSIVSVNIADLPNCNSFEYIGKPDVLIHCAWEGLPNYKSLHHIEDELYKQYRFITRLVKDGLKNILITGTCFEYGMQSGALYETMSSQPNTPYGFAKNTLLQKLLYFQNTYPFHLTWARLFYLYGDGQSKNALFSQLKTAIQNNDGVFPMSRGEQLRDYLPISTASQHLVSLAALQKNIGIINICSGIPISIRALVEKWLHENDWRITLKLGHYAYSDYEPMAFWGDINKLHSYIQPMG